MLSSLFNKIGEKSLYVAPAVQEAAIASVILYGQQIMQFLNA